MAVSDDLFIGITRFIVIAISDVAWSPDNLHFASCSTDSTICIWDVNEHGKY